MAISMWSLWATVFRPLAIGVGAGLIVTLLLYVVGVSCGWFRQKLNLTTVTAGGLEVANSGGNDAGDQGTTHPDHLPSNMGIPNSGAEGLPPHAAHAHATVWVDLEMGARKDIQEVGESANQPLVSANEEMDRRPEMETCCTSSQEE